MSGVLKRTNGISLVLKEIGDFRTENTGQNGHGSTRSDVMSDLAHHCLEQAKRAEGQITRGINLSKPL